MISLKQTRRARVLGVLMLLAFLVAPTCAALASAFNPQPDPPGYSMVGIAAGQTARLNVVLTNPGTDRSAPPDPCAPPDPYSPPDPYVPPGPSRVRLYVINGDGRVLAEASKALNLCQAGSLEYPAPAGMPAGARQRIRAVVVAEADDSGFTPAVKTSLEIVNDETQRTAVLYPGVTMRHEPAADIDLGLLGVGRGQVVRLNAVNDTDFHNPNRVPPDPYRVTLRLYSADNRLLAERAYDLGPGRAASLDMRGDDVLAGTGSGLVRAVVHVDADPSGLVPCIMPSAEIFNADTGRTQVLLPAVQ